MALFLSFTMWFALAWAPPQARISSAPVPSDPHELVTSSVHFQLTPAERAAALSLLERASQNAKLHMPGTPPYQLNVAFTASGNAKQTGPGELTELWMSGQSWRWTANLAGASMVRIGYQGRTVEDKHIAEIPMRVQMLRNAIFWAAQQSPSSAQIRTAQAQWNNQPVTCLLTSGVAGEAVQLQGRLWEEMEYCIDNASGLLQIYSVAPGTYVVYGYSKNLEFHTRVLPDRITIYVAGAVVLDGTFSITDAPSSAPTLLTPTQEMLANDQVITSMLPRRFPINAPGPSGTIQPVIVHAEIDGEGNVLEAELSAAADPALAQSALDLVKRSQFPGQPLTQRQAYINVRFGAPSQ